MKNILNIIRHDLKKISGSVVAIVTIMGLCLVPCSYAWFNILSNWAPYESEATGRISVAVANMDEGASAAGLKINVGEKIVEGLAANDDIGWVFLDSDKEAINGVYAGDYYAALVVPEDFTTHVLSFMSGDLTNPKLHYYENEKKNAIAPKITGKAKTAVQEQVNATFVETLAGYVSDAASIAEANGLDPQQMLDDLSERIEDLSGDLDDCIALTNSASGLTDAAGNLMEVSGGFMDSTHDVFASNDKLLQNLETELSKIKKTDTSKLEAAVEQAKTDVSSLRTVSTEVTELLSASDIAFDLFIDTQRDKRVAAVNRMKSSAEEQEKVMRSEGFTAVADKFAELAETLGSISAGYGKLEKGMSYEERKAILEQIEADSKKASDLSNEIPKMIRTDIDSGLAEALENSKSAMSRFRKAMSSADKDLTKLGNNMSSYNSALSGLKSSIDTTTANLRSVQGGADALADLMKDTSGNVLLQELSDLLANDETAVAEYLANPIKMDTEVMWPIENYGSAMAPFYTVLAQWVGALLTAVLIKVKIRKRDDLTHLKLHEWYFGRYGLYLAVGLAQALVVALGDLLYVHIQCGHPLLFVLEACVNGMVFMMINYALVFALDNIGLGAGVIVLVLQVAGSGGTYPVEVLPKIFQVLFPAMPFRYAMDAMRECIGGMYDGTYWKCIGILMLFMAGAILFGMAFYAPAKKLNEMIAASKAKSEIML